MAKKYPITLLFIDEKENHNNALRQIGAEQFQGVECFETYQEFENFMENPKNKDLSVLLFIHVFRLEDYKGYKHDASWKIIKREYPSLEIHWITSDKPGATSDAINQQHNTFKYDDIPEYIDSKVLMSIEVSSTKQNHSQPTSKHKETGSTISPHSTSKNIPKDIDFGIITALYEHEFEEVKKLINWETSYRTKTKAFRIGRMKDNQEIKVVAAIPAKTGMVDSAIIATQILELFKPKFLLMSGVCGGKKTLGFGDIVLASKVFTFQKGKISELLDDEGHPIKLYNRRKKELDISHIYDKNGNQVEVQIENFEVEEESIEIDPLVKDDVDDFIKSIKDKINEPYKLDEQKIDIHFEPMACSTMVINKDGYFEDKIKVIERKTVAVEMESFGVARACKFANNGETKFLIFKSVMDNMTKKDDKAKELAAYTSAQFLKYLIIDNVLLQE
ncbi:MAG: hypothetical protein PHW82_03465 [Bacteroidales bacterium]|nr:hypothetical protein [Bacteroidales bacterium]